MADKTIRINKAIRVNEVRLIEDEGSSGSILPIQEALRIAEDLGLDLIEVAPNAKPPVCKILDFGKYKYEMEKKQRESKRNQTLVKLKEIRMQPKIEKHDLEFKTNHIQEFLAEGSKVKVTVRFKGRELAHTERGKTVLDKILAMLEEREFPCNVDKAPQMEGRFMSMTISPKNKK